MLEIQKFCMENPNWKSLLKKEPYNLKISERDNLVIFKYDLIHSNFNEKICREARGLILEKDTWEVIRIAFDKFFNIDEGHAATIDWNSAAASQKEDGSLISLYYYKDNWHVATNGTIDAAEAKTGSLIFETYYDLAVEAFTKYDIDFSKLNKDYTYTFELCSPYNMIVCRYDEIKLFLTCVRNRKTLEEIDIFAEKVDIGVPLPKFYKLNSEKEYRELVENFGENTEGIVVKDKFNNRIKIKTPLYFKLHKMNNNGQLLIEDAVEMVLNNDTEEFISYFPHYKSYLDNLKVAIEGGFELVDKIELIVNNWKAANKEGTRKEFSDFVRENKNYAALYYLAYDGKNVKTYVKEMKTNKLIGLFGLREIK